MKKLVLAMACVLSLGLLASCKQGTQDVNVKNQETSKSNDFIGTVELTSTVVEIDSTKAFVDTPAANDAIKVSPKFATVKWTAGADVVETNYKAFKIEFPVAYVSDTTVTTSDPSFDINASLTVYKIGDKYYTDDTFETTANGNAVSKRTEIECPSGSPASGTFILKNIGVIAIGTNRFARVSELKFTRAK